METLNIQNKMFVAIAMMATLAACNKVAFNEVASNTTSSVVDAGPEPSPSTNAPPATKSISKTEVVAYGNKQVDFLLVLDDSNSMLPELQKLAARLSTFVSSLDASDIDWQMCLTTTRGYGSAAPLTYGPSLSWRNYSPSPGVPAYLLKKGTAGLSNIFTSTINNLTIGGANSGDERGIKAAHDHFAASGSHSCYRTGAALSVIMISDEDERSVGGDASAVKAKDAAGAYQPMEASDQPETLVQQAKTTFGENVRLTFSSIIVKPGDVACEAEQDLDTSPSHPGKTYERLSKLTDGGVGSICDSDYKSNLKTFKDKIVNSLSSLALECEPRPNSLKIKINGIPLSGFKNDGKILKFAYALIEGTRIDLNYDCDEDKKANSKSPSKSE